MTERSARPSFAVTYKYGVPLLCVAAALIVARLLDVYLVTAPVSLFLCAIMLSGWIGGYTGGLLSVVLSTAAFVFYFITPLNSWAVAVNEIPRTIIFVLSELFVGWLSAAQRGSTESLKHARDKLADTVHELVRTNEALEAEGAERTRTAEALRQVQADLARASRITAMGELTASLAHEVNQPIAAAVIDANSCWRWLAGETPNLDEARAAARRIVTEGTRASEIIGRVGRLFKKSAAEREMLDMNGVISEVVELLRAEAAKYSVTIHTELAADLPQLSGDRVQLQQVVLNLILNAIEAMKSVDSPRVLTIESHRSDSGRVVVSVSDSGTGLPKEQDQIFKAFFTTKADGIGMGLAISRSIIESHGGRLWASANVPRGAQLHFELPLVAD